MSSGGAGDDPRRKIPGVDRLLEAAGELVDRHGAAETATALRAAIQEGRDRVADGTWPRDPAEPGPWVEAAAARLAAREIPSLRPVLNATGVVLHTNLGRAPLAPEALEAARRASEGYASLEFDLDAGVRGSRYDHARDLIRELTGAEDALVVNNCAAALLLALSAAARGREVVISRGELVEIGGGFRIPEVLERAGADLVEVGTTNRTRAADYDAAAESVRVAALLKVHRSNFSVTGFTESASLEELVEVAARRRLQVVHDLGSGLLVHPARLALPDEPMPAASIAAGADVVVFSGDKLLGGPQAGIVAGSAELVGRMRRDPLCRALRVDKATLAALEATLRLYRNPERALRSIPTLRALATPADEIEARCARAAEALAAGLGGTSDRVDVVAVPGRVGGGTFPDHAIASHAVRIRPGGGDARTESWAQAARTRAYPDRPVVGRIEEGAWLLDLRCVPDADVPALVDTVLAARPEPRA